MPTLRAEFHHKLLLSEWLPWYLQWRLFDCADRIPWISVCVEIFVLICGFSSLCFICVIRVCQVLVRVAAWEGFAWLSWLRSYGFAARVFFLLCILAFVSLKIGGCWFALALHLFPISLFPNVIRRWISQLAKVLLHHQHRIVFRHWPHEILWLPITARSSWPILLMINILFDYDDSLFIWNYWIPLRQDVLGPGFLIRCFCLQTSLWI